MKKFIFIAVILIGTVSSLFGQLTVTSTSPSTGYYTSCSNSNTTCSGTPYYGATIRMKIFNISANSIAFMIAKCDGGAFSTSGTAYLRNGSVCGSSIISAGYSSGVTSKSLTYTFPSAGTYTIYGTTTTSGGANYYTDPITVVVSAPQLATPTPTSGSNISSDKFTANWSSVTGASYYNVKVKNCADATYNNTATYTSYSNSYTFSNLSCGGCYQYQVQAVGSSGNTSDYSSSGPTVQLTQCNVPSSSGVSFSSITTNSFRANWPSVSGASGYEVNYTTCNGSYTSTQSLYTSTNSITISGLSPGTSYKMRLRAVCSSSCSSPMSNSTSCVTTSEPVITFSVSVPTNVTYYTNQALPISWTSPGLSSGEKVQMELWTCDGVFHSVLFPNVGTSNTGSVNWTIPSTVESASYKIKIYKLGCTSTSNCASAFTSCFSIVLPNNGGLRVNGGITANVYPTSAGNGVLQTCKEKSISFSLTNTKNIAINRGVILFMYNTTTGNAEPVWKQEMVLQPGEMRQFDRTSTGLSGVVNSAVGSYQLELQATENSGISFSYNTANRVPAVSGTNPLNISVINGCGGLRLTSGINATTYPTSSGANILKKCVDKNISYTLKNTSNTTINRAVKLWMVNSSGTTDLVWKKAITLTAGQTLTFTRTEQGLGETVTKDPGTYRLVMQAVDGGDAALGFSYNTANNVPGEGGQNDVTVQVNDGCTPTLTVTSPILNQVFNCGTSATISWTTTNLASTANMAIELVNTTTPNSTVYVITNGTPNSGSYTWSIPSTLPATITPGNYKIKVYQVGSGIPNNLSPACSVGCTTTCVTWTGGSNPLDAESALAYDYLCDKKIIISSQTVTSPLDTLRRDYLAKVLYKGLYYPNIATNASTSESTPMDYAPNPFLDLQPTSTYYVNEAKALSYLEYGDGVPVFNRTGKYFKARNGIERRWVVKALLEAFNISIANVSTSLPAGWFTDVPVSDPAYKYIRKAFDLGIVKSQTLFNPGRKIITKDAFILLYRTMKLCDDNTITKPTPTIASYFMPSNFKTVNFARLLGIQDGNFNSYTKTSFGIAGLMPLAFAHSYNSCYTELPDDYRAVEPLGKGWSHNYNCYIEKVDDEDPTTPGNLKTILTWGDGTMISFNENANTWTSETAGTYGSLTPSTSVSSPASFYYKTKSQITYQFDRFIAGKAIWMLSKVTDRNGNSISLTWAIVTSGGKSQTRLNRVADQQGRYLQFSYETGNPAKIKGVTAVTGSISRSVTFTYNGDYSDLLSYTDPRGKISTYIYADAADPINAHLLRQIRLPKGNVVDNTYQNRKLVSTQMAGQYTTSVATTQNYTAGATSDYTSASISTTRKGQTLTNTIMQDLLGNLKTAISPTGTLQLSYDNGSHPTKPTSFVNSTNGLSAAPVYDANGNVLSITKTAGSTSITESYTYNGYNDILTYTNGRGYRTTFAYNATGNLTSVTDPAGNTTSIIPNSNGTVQRATNPEGIYTTFSYDNYGNTTQTSLMNAISSQAAYDDASRMIRSVNPNGVVTAMQYDNSDMVQSVINDQGGLNNTVTYAYDDNDNLVAVTNPKGGVTSLTYNNYDQLTQYSFGGFAKSYSYNNDGTLNSFTSQNGNTFNNTYNTDGTLASDGYATYAYNTSTKDLTGISRNGKTIGFEYDALKRTTRVKYNDFSANGSNGVQYDYDNNNNVTRVTYPNGFAVGYEYDNLDRLTRVYNVANSSDYATYTYLRDGRLKTQTNGNGTKTVYGYDNYGRLNSMSNQTSGGAVIAAFTYEMDNNGNHTAETENIPNGLTAPTPTNASIPYTHDNANRMLTRSNTIFNYDNNGNNTKAAGEWNSNYTYDIRDNLLTSSTPALTYEYDALENRRLKNQTRYVLDVLGGNNVLMETDLSGNPTAYYIHGLGMICRLDAAQANPAYYHYDYRGSTIAITNASQTVTHRYAYGTFGEMAAVTENGFSNPFRYVGKYGVQYEDNSLYFMRARYYNPQKGRFLGEDPIWNTNLFGYAGNNPIDFIDPLGLLCYRAMNRIKDAKENVENYKNNDPNFNIFLSFLETTTKTDPDELNFDIEAFIEYIYENEISINTTINKDGTNKLQGPSNSINTMIQFYKDILELKNEKYWTSKKNANEIRKASIILRISEYLLIDAGGSDLILKYFSNY